MAWNFCPECGHRIYRHNADGCTHVEDVVMPCYDGGCELGAGLHGHSEPVLCDCTRGHPFLIKGQT
jgi:hypothetical protein